MNVILDIGNSVAKVTVFDERKPIARRLLTDSAKETFREILSSSGVTDGAFSCVGNDPNGLIDVLLEIVPNALRLSGLTPVPLAVDYLTPETLGADRLAASVGASTVCPKSDLLIIDIGTCITYDYVTASGRYSGGNISPGIGMRLRSLHRDTAALPLVSAKGDFSTTGRNTETAIRAGVLLGIRREIEGTIQAFKQACPPGKTFLTGGGSSYFPDLTVDFRYDNLVETGLNTILLYNR